MFNRRRGGIITLRLPRSTGSRVKEIGEMDKGIVLYIIFRQEGRGIGLTNKIPRL